MDIKESEQLNILQWKLPDPTNKWLLSQEVIILPYVILINKMIVVNLTQFLFILVVLGVIDNIL